MSISFRIFFIVACILLVLLQASSCGKEKAALYTPPDCDTANTKYNDTIANIIALKCSSGGCHISGGTGNGDFTSYLGVNLKVGNGSFETRVFQTQDMPPSHFSEQLTECEKKKLKHWLDIGAPNN